MHEHILMELVIIIQSHVRPHNTDDIIKVMGLKFKVRQRWV